MPGEAEPLSDKGLPRRVSVGGRADFTGSTQKFSLENQRSEQTPREKDEVGRVERATWRLPCSDQAHKGQKKDPLLYKGRGT